MMKKLNFAKIGMAAAAVLLAGGAAQVSANAEVQNPSITDQSTTWDCVWFGNYFQSSLDEADLTDDVIDADYDENNIAYIDETAYKRLGSGGSYTYYRAEPIKWRVLSVNGSDAFLLADQNLEVMPYNNAKEPGSFWEKSFARSWLNGYDAEANDKGEEDPGIDCTEYNFKDLAFTEEEQQAILLTTLPGGESPEYSPNSYSNSTEDWIYLVSMPEICTTSYGFDTDIGFADTARKGLNTAYTAAGGANGGKNMMAEGSSDNYFLRSPGEYVEYTAYVNNNGTVFDGGTWGSNTVYCYRPALHLDLSMTDVWSEAGTAEMLQQQIYVAEEEITRYLGDASFSLGATCDSGGTMTYSSSNTNVVTVRNGNVTIKDIGTAVITISVAGDNIYQSASLEIPVTILDPDAEPTETPEPTEEPEPTETPEPSATRKDQSISGVKASYSKAVGKTVTLSAKTSGDGAISYKSSDTSVAKVTKAGKVTFKAPGTATITITAAQTENYNSASKEVSITVKPKKVTISSAKSGAAKKMTVKWKKVSGITKYEISYSTNKNFKASKTKTVKAAAGKKSKTIKGLKSGKKYYVRIRAFKKTSSGKVYGAYSKKLSVKVK